MRYALLVTLPLFLSGCLWPRTPSIGGKSGKETPPADFWEVLSYLSIWLAYAGVGTLVAALIVLLWLKAVKTSISLFTIGGCLLASALFFDIVADYAWIFITAYWVALALAAAWGVLWFKRDWAVRVESVVGDIPGVGDER